MMTKKNYTIALLGALTLLFAGCSKQLEDKLLSTKSYFENTYVPIEVRGESTLSYTLTTRASSPVAKDTKITYRIGTTADIEEYNKLNNTDYLPFPLEDVSLPKPEGTIPSGSIYTTPVDLQFKGLDKVEAGKTFLVPVHFESEGSAPAIASSQTMYLALQKPIQLHKVAQLNSSYWSKDWISVPRLTDYTFESVTYEALIHATDFGGNSTVMGVEGKLILRIGDVGGGLPRDRIQIAGNKQFHYDSGLSENKWYHVAFTFNHNTGKAFIYINGKPVANGDWDQIADIREGFAIGRVPHFMWGERPFSGYMAEVRLWNVARSETEIQQNMLRVDPKSSGLIVYYHLNGEDVTQDESGKWSVLDATGNGLNGEPNDGLRGIKSEELSVPLEAKDLL